MGAVKKENDLIIIDRQDLMEIKSMLKLLLPSEFTISYVARIAGKSNQAVTQWMLRNAEPEVDFWKKGGKIIISEKTALKYISERSDLLLLIQTSSPKDYAAVWHCNILAS